MGLLVEGAGIQDLPECKKIIEAVLYHWETNLGLSPVSLSEDDLLDMCRIGELLFNGTELLRNPSPFKRAAAFCILFRLLCEPEFGNEDFEKAKEDWVSRLSYCSIPFVLANCPFINAEGSSVMLQAIWQPGSKHMKAELIALLRSLELPYQLPGHESGQRTVDTTRLSRAVLALSLTIESCYYLVEATSEPIPMELIKGSDNCSDPLPLTSQIDVDFETKYWAGPYGANQPWM